jgi:hypothetical protein
MIKNVIALKGQQDQQNEDLKFMADCLRKVMQRKSMTWIAHQDGEQKVTDGDEPSKRKKLVPKNNPSSLAIGKSTMSNMNIGKSTMNNGMSTMSLSMTKDPKDLIAEQTANNQELYDQFMCNQVVQLSSMYMLSVIDKYMEMQHLSQER